MNFKQLSAIQWIGLGLSLVGTICSIVSILAAFGKIKEELLVLFVPAFLCAILSYLFCGGLGYTIKSAFGIAKTMWFIIPHFPIDLLMGIIGFAFGLIALFFLPLFFTVKSIRNKQKMA